MSAQGPPATPPDELTDVVPAEPAASEPAPTGALSGIVFRGAAYSSAGFALEQCLTVAAAITLAHLVTPKEFGIYGSATILLGYAAMFADSGLQSAVIQRRDRVSEAASTAFAANVVSGIGLALLAAGLAPVLALFFDDSTIGWVAAAMAGTVALNSLLLVPDALLQRNFSFLRRLFVSPSAALTYGAVTGVVAALGFGVWSLVIGRYSAIVVELVVIWALVGWRPQRSAISFAMWRSLAQYGRHIFAASFLSQSRSSVVTAMLGRFVGIGAVGQFRYANTMASLPRSTWVVSSSYVVFPAFARIAHETDRFRAAFLRTMRWAGIATFPTSAILLPLGPSLVVLVLGDEWRQAGYAAMALVGYPLVGPLTSVLSEGVKGMGRPDVLSRTALVSTVGTLLFAAAFVPLGVVGIAGAYSLSSMFTVAVMLKLSMPLLSIDRASVVRTLGPSFLATAAMVALLFPLEWLLVRADERATATGLLLLLGEAVLGLAVYVWILRFLDRDAVESLWRGARAVKPKLTRRHSPQTLS